MSALVFSLKRCICSAGAPGDPVEGGVGSLSPPDGFLDVAPFMAFKEDSVAKAEGLPEVPLRTVDLQWLQVRSYCMFVVLGS